MTVVANNVLKPLLDVSLAIRAPIYTTMFAKTPVLTNIILIIQLTHVTSACPLVFHVKIKVFAQVVAYQALILI